MDRQYYLRRLRARLEHIDTALQRSLGADATKTPALESLREHAARIEGTSDDDWHDVREHVERSWSDLHAEVSRHGSTLEEVAESVRDGAVELFRPESNELLERLKKKG